MQGLSKAGAGKVPEKVVSKWTPEDEASRKIQKIMRGYSSFYCPNPSLDFTQRSNPDVMYLTLIFHILSLTLAQRKDGT